MTAQNLPGDINTALGELWRRVQILEAVPGGIRFDFDNQGGWLEITTNDTIAIGGIGDLGEYHNDLSGGGIVFDSRDIGGVLNARLSLIDGAAVLTGTTNLFLRGSDGGASEEISGGGIAMELNAAGHVFFVQDSLLNSIFEVREDGSVHILTGTAVIADL